MYGQIPDLGGFVLKADSEGRLGPSAYGRTHADAANVIARALAPHGGVLFYRGFVYDNKMDWRNLKNDRARAAVDNFKALDGQFDDNVILQIKNGPIDFQVREPASPLFGAAAHQPGDRGADHPGVLASSAARHLPPMWKEVLDFDMQVKGKGTTVESDRQRPFGRPLSGFVGVSNVGLTGTGGAPPAMSNLTGSGGWRDPRTSSDRIADEWTQADLWAIRVCRRSRASSASRSRPTRTTELARHRDAHGILGVHFGPGVESSERNGWGQWHRADGNGVGMDRTAATGTGFISQYSPEVARVYESLATCPEELLLFMHHVPYTHRLRSGKTVIQHIYDQHYLGAEQAAGFAARWRSLENVIDRERYSEVLDRLEFQAVHAVVAATRSTVGSSAPGIADERVAWGEPGRAEVDDDARRVRDYRHAPNRVRREGGRRSAAAGCSASFEYRDAQAAAHRRAVLRPERRRLALPIARGRARGRSLDGGSRSPARRVERTHGDAPRRARGDAVGGRPHSPGGGPGSGRARAGGLRGGSRR
jgi:alpha-glucuronidase